MDDRRHKIAAYLQPAFLICAAVLAWAGVGMSLAAQRLGLYLKKEPLPLKKPLEALDEAKLAPYKVTAKIRIENQDIRASLGTEDYIQWLLEDPREPTESAVRKLLLFVTYYRRPDRVPHVPEECYTGGGYERLATNAVAFQIGTREIPGRYLLFAKTAQDLALAMPQFPVLYLFRVNGEYAGSRDEARMALNKNVFSTHSYFCKIELVFNQSSTAPTREMATAASGKLLAVLLPLLEQEHWPDLATHRETSRSGAESKDVGWLGGSLKAEGLGDGCIDASSHPQSFGRVRRGAALEAATHLSRAAFASIRLHNLWRVLNHGESSWREEGV